MSNDYISHDAWAQLYNAKWRWKHGRYFMALLYSAPGYNPRPRHVCAVHPDYRSAVVRSILRTQFLRGSEASPWSLVPAVPSDQWLHLVAHIIIVCLIFAGGGHMWYCDQDGYYHHGTSIFCHLQADTSKVGVVLGSDAAQTKYKLLSSWRFPSTL